MLFYYFLIILNSFLMAGGQMFFKKSALVFDGAQNLSIIEKYLYNPWFFMALFMFGISTLSWVKILTKINISVAYPLLSLSYILTAIGAFYFFDERLKPINILGILVIMLGISLISIK
ncbi:MAG: EamA family transporter [Candidatus Moranbacteria bacterium]|nr:EamA family transporter [Candidatus Moranbacteria bacterium]